MPVLSSFPKVLEDRQKVLVHSKEVWLLGPSQLSEAVPGETALDILGGRCHKAERFGGLLALPPAKAPVCPQGQGYAEGQRCI